ncbi:hypothetical protein BaRGS_00001129 [Batillaria attramentaria]|uniref:Uncharacterized protein n=1 Tax=Batillaria attramentaria TaxID=370345 RepID=A0ABD0M623_9CAEN
MAQRRRKRGSGTDSGQLEMCAEKAQPERNHDVTEQQTAYNGTFTIQWNISQSQQVLVPENLTTIAVTTDSRH